MRRIERMEREMAQKHHTLETLRKDKVDLEQTLEQEQEALVNKLWKRMDKLEREKRSLQEKLNQPISSPPSPPPEPIGFPSTTSQHAAATTSSGPPSTSSSSRRLSRDVPFSPTNHPLVSQNAVTQEDTERMSMHIRQLRRETEQLKKQLKSNQSDHEQR